MLTPQIYIEIELATGVVLQMDFCGEVRVAKSLKELTQTCTITQAKRILISGKDIGFNKPLQETIKAGNFVRVWMRYAEENEDYGIKSLEFVGYVRNINPQVPIIIECEDEMYKLKRTEVAPKTFLGGTVQDVLVYMFGNKYILNVVNSSLGGAFAITRDENTPAKVLKKIEEVYGLKSNFRYTERNGKLEQELRVGTQYQAEQTLPIVKYKLNRNVIENSLSFTSADDKQIKVKVTSRQPDGKVLTSRFMGDGEGDSKELQIPGLSQEQIEAYAKRLYQESKVDSFEGSMTTFGLPRIEPGQLAEVDTVDFELVKTTNYADEVVTTFGTGGWRREVTLGPQLRDSGNLRLVAQ
jgi:hypothetical protein